MPLQQYVPIDPSVPVCDEENCFEILITSNGINSRYACEYVALSGRFIVPGGVTPAFTVDGVIVVMALFGLSRIMEQYVVSVCVSSAEVAVGAGGSERQSHIFLIISCFSSGAV